MDNFTMHEEHAYLVAFTYSKQAGIGNTQEVAKPSAIVLRVQGLVTREEDIEELGQAVEEQTGYSAVKVLSFSLIK